MNTILVTGATGFLGKQLANRLANEGNLVHALYRSEEKIRGWEHKNIKFFRGNLNDTESIERAMQNCQQVYHLAAFASVWHRNSNVFYKENVGGTENILNAAKKLGVKKLVFTSTAGVLGPSGGGVNTEEKVYTGEHLTHYDRSKALAEAKVQEFAEAGLPVCIVNPTRIFGPGILSKSNALTTMVSKYIHGNWRFIPGNGKAIGNYVYLEDVVDGHIRAMEKGHTGERYLLGGEDLSFNDIFEKVRSISGINKRVLHIPLSVLMILSYGFVSTTLLTGLKPPITPAFVKRYQNNWSVSSEKAIHKLGYSPTSFEDGLQKTIEWLQQ